MQIEHENNEHAETMNRRQIVIKPVFEGGIALRDSNVLRKCSVPVLNSVPITFLLSD